MHADFSMTEADRKQLVVQSAGVWNGVVQGSRQGSFCELLVKWWWWYFQGLRGPAWARCWLIVPPLDMWYSRVELS